jgi:hypothetical protein
MIKVTHQKLRLPILESPILRTIQADAFKILNRDQAADVTKWLYPAGSQELPAHGRFDTQFSVAPESPEQDPAFGIFEYREIFIG